MNIEVGFCNGNGSLNDPVLKHMERLFREAFASLQPLYGNSKLLCLLRTHLPGSSQKRGAVIPKYMEGRYLRVVAQPGDNNTCWEVLVSVPDGKGEDVAIALETLFQNEMSEELRLAREMVAAQLSSYSLSIEAQLQLVRSIPVGLAGQSR